MGRLDGKVAIVTGAARGQGTAEARVFAREGATVFLTDVLDEPGEKTAAEFGGTFLHHDVTREDEWQAVVGKVLASHGQVNVLVNNAGIFASSPIDETDLEDYRRVIEVNQVGVFLGMKAVTPPMKQAESGSIINISSVAGLRGPRNAVAYTASKWAVRGMTKVAAAELGRYGVRVNSIHPGLIETDMMKALPRIEDLDRWTRNILLGRQAQPEEVANLALFLASDESSYCTNSEFIVDGGTA